MTNYIQQFRVCKLSFWAILYNNSVHAVNHKLNHQIPWKDRTPTYYTDSEIFTENQHNTMKKGYKKFPISKSKNMKYTIQIKVGVRQTAACLTVSTDMSHHCFCCCDDDGRSVSPWAARLFGVGAVTTLLFIHGWFMTYSNGRRWLGSCRNNYTNTCIHTCLRADRLAGNEWRQRL